MDMKELYWAAGLLEGEGFFCKQTIKGRTYVSVGCEMGDRDVLQRMANLFKLNVTGPAYRKRPSAKSPLAPMYRMRVCGRKAAGIMMTLYPLMGLRRKARIKELLVEWRRR